MGLTPAARTATRTSPGAGSGVGRSITERTSGPPKAVATTTALISAQRRGPRTSSRELEPALAAPDEQPGTGPQDDGLHAAVEWGAGQSLPAGLPRLPGQKVARLQATSGGRGVQ